MTGGIWISGNSDTISETIRAIDAWFYSSRLILKEEQRRFCFQGKQGRFSIRKHPKFALARRLSRLNFYQMFPEYVRKCRNGSISPAKKEEMFNVFSEDGLKGD